MTEASYPDDPGVGDLVHLGARTLAKTLVSLGLPVDVASLAVDALAMYFPSPLEKRKAEFWAGLVEMVQRHESVLREHELGDHESYMVFLVGVFRRASETAETDKLKYYRNALVNVAIRPVRRVDYLRTLLDALTVDHLSVLDFLSRTQGGARLRAHYLAEDVAALMADRVSTLNGDAGYAEVLFRDVWSRNLLVYPHSVSTVMSPGKEKKYVLDGSRLSQLGEDFLGLIREPGDGVSLGAD